MSKKIITVRAYQSSDAQDLANIYYNTIHSVNSKDYTQEQIEAWAPESSLDAEKWAKKFENTKPLVAVCDGTVVGFAEFEPDGHIDCFYCHHEWIGFGIGTALMQAIHENANLHKINKIFVEVSLTALPIVTWLSEPRLNVARRKLQASIRHLQKSRA